MLVLLDKVDNRAFCKCLARAVQRQAARCTALLVHQLEIILRPVVLCHAPIMTGRLVPARVKTEVMSHFGVYMEQILIAEHRLGRRHVYKTLHVLAAVRLWSQHHPASRKSGG